MSARHWPLRMYQGRARAGPAGLFEATRMGLAPRLGRASGFWGVGATVKIARYTKPALTHTTGLFQDPGPLQCSFLMIPPRVECPAPGPVRRSPGNMHLVRGKSDTAWFFCLWDR